MTSLPGENAECLCHGLVEVFEHIGGVPPVIVMDNATDRLKRALPAHPIAQHCDEDGVARQLIEIFGL